MSAVKAEFGPRIGADPELFVTKDGKIIPVCGLVGGTKEAPIKVDTMTVCENRRVYFNRGLKGQFAYQEDGCAFEFNIPASNDAGDFYTSVTAMLDYSKRLLEAKGLGIAETNRNTFTPDQMIPEQCRTIGCSADYDAYKDEGERERKPVTAEQLGNDRFAGGHVHVEYNHNNVPKHVFVQFLDVMLALPTLTWDKQGARRAFYGVPGLYRPKDYGAEYRVLSNFWLKDAFRDQLMYIGRIVLQLAQLANKEFETLEDAYPKIPWTDVHQAILTEDHVKAKELLAFIGGVTKLPLESSIELLICNARKEERFKKKVGPGGLQWVDHNV